MTKELDLTLISSESKKSYPSSSEYRNEVNNNNQSLEPCKSLFSYLSRQKNKSSSASTHYSKPLKSNHSLTHKKKVLYDDCIETVSYLSDTDKSSSHNSFITKDLPSDRHSLEDYYTNHYLSNNNLAWLTKKSVVTASVNNNKKKSINVSVPANMNPVSRLLIYSEATTEACEAIGRMMVHNVDSYNIQQFIDNYIVSKQIVNGKTKNLSGINMDYLQTNPHEKISSSSSSSSSPTVVSNFQTAILPSLPCNISWIGSPNEFKNKKDIDRLQNNQETIEMNDKEIEEEYIISPSNKIIQSQDSISDNHYTLSKVDYKKLSPKMSLSLRQKSTIKELMETETKYLEDLRVLVMHFFDVISDAKCITLEQSEIIVRNGEELLQFQEDFFEALQYAHEYNVELHKLSSTPNIKKIAECFIKWGPKFEIYMGYCVGQDKAMDTYRELLEINTDFSNLMERTHNFLRVSLGFGLGSKLNFDDYLITPFQRVFRYRLILQSIIKTVEIDSDEYYSLNKAQDIMHCITTRLNTTKSKLEAERKTKLFLGRLQNDWAIPKRWHSTLGSCLLIGTLDIMQDMEEKKIKRYGCALFGMYAIIVKPKKKKMLYEPRVWFPLRMFEFKDMDELDGTIPFAWKLYNDQHTIIFSATCEQEKQIWIQEFRAAIDDSKAQYENHLWDIQNRGSVIEQLFVSSFDKIENIKQRQQNLISPSSYLSSRSSIRKSLTRRKSTPLFLHSNESVKVSSPHLSNYLTENTNRLNSTSSDLFIDPAHHQHMYPSSSKNDLTSSYSLHNTTTVKRSQSSMNDLKGFFHSNVTGKWSQHRYTQYQSRRMAVDEKFEDVSTTNILTARKLQDRNGLFE